MCYSFHKKTQVTDVNLFFDLLKSNDKTLKIAI